MCKPCENKPTNAVYSGLAASSSNCPYECQEDLDPVEVNELCLNALEVQVSRVGGVFSTLTFFSVFMALALVMWITLII